MSQEAPGASDAGQELAWVKRSPAARTGKQKARIQRLQATRSEQEEKRLPSQEAADLRFGAGPDGRVFVANRECPFRCVMCDLWMHTLDGDTPRGAVPAQIRGALSRPGRSRQGLQRRAQHLHGRGARLR